MISSLNTAASFLSIAFNILLIALLLRGFYRKYIVLFLYASVHLLTGFLENLLFYTKGPESTFYINVYWIDEILVDTLLFLMVIVLIREVAAGRPTGALAGKLLAVVVAAAIALPFVFGNHPLTPGSSPPRLSGRWFFSASQILNFGGALMNLVLWGNLIGTKQRDPRMLTICAGLGVAVTGQAVRYGIIALRTTSGVSQAANVFGVLTHIAGLVIWCWAFRPSSSTPVPPAATSS